MYIDLKNINKTYERNILKDLSYKFEGGKCYGLLGENGAGKSTLLKIIAQLETKCSGEIEYSGFNPKIDLTYLGPTSYIMNKTVYENIAYPLKIRGYEKEKIQLLVDDICIKFGIENFKNVNARKLSSGESQKLLLARAMVFKPKILLLDEPTSNIDEAFIKTIEKAIKTIDYKCIVVLVTHNIDHAKSVSDEILILEGMDIKIANRGD